MSNVIEFRGRTRSEAMSKARREMGPEMRTVRVQKIRRGLFWPFLHTEYAVHVEPKTNLHDAADDIPDWQVGLVADRIPLPPDKLDRAAILAAQEEVKATLNGLRSDIERRYGEDGLERLKMYVEHTSFSEETKRLILLKTTPRLMPGTSPSQLVREALSGMIQTVEMRRSHQKVMLVGPTGVGKTTTIAKLATQAHLQRRLRCGIVTTDTYRVGAVDQSKLYSDILQIPFRAVSSPDEMEAAMRELSGLDHLFIDSVGLSPTDNEKLQEMMEFARIAKPDLTLLCLSLTTKLKDMKRIYDVYRPFRIDAMIFTKRDEASDVDTILDMMLYTGKGASFVTTGQAVPYNIEPATTEYIGNLLTESV